MTNRELATGERSQKIDLNLRLEVVAFPFEPFVRLLLNYDDYVSCLHTRRLIALSMEHDGLAALHALVYVDFEHLLLRNNLLAVTRLTPVPWVVNLARPATFVARLLDLLDHRAHLAHHDTDTATVTRVALLDRTLFPAPTVALDAEDVPRERELRHLALVQVFEGHGDAVYEILRLARSGLASTSAEEAATAK